MQGLLPYNVEQTDKQFKIRITEYHNHIYWNTSTRSVIIEHRLQMTHEFDWNNIQILDEQACYNKRLISEMLNKAI